MSERTDRNAWDVSRDPLETLESVRDERLTGRFARLEGDVEHGQASQVLRRAYMGLERVFFSVSKTVSNSVNVKLKLTKGVFLREKSDLD